MVVSNTSPVLNLSIIGHIDLLRQQFGVLHIPTAVWTELRSDEALPGSAAIAEAARCGWLQVAPVLPSPLLNLLKVTLDDGESEALALATEQSAELLLMDEREGRQAARRLGIPITGTLGVLLRARLNQRLLSLKEAMFALEHQAGFRIHPELRRALLEEAGETA